MKIAIIYTEILVFLRQFKGHYTVRSLCEAKKIPRKYLSVFYMDKLINKLANRRVVSENR